MADKKLNALSVVNNAKYAYLEDGNGNQVKMEMSTLASVVGGLTYLIYNEDRTMLIHVGKVKSQQEAVITLYSKNDLVILSLYIGAYSSTGNPIILSHSSDNIYYRINNDRSVDVYYNALGSMILRLAQPIGFFEVDMTESTVAISTLKKA